MNLCCMSRCHFYHLIKETKSANFTCKILFNVNWYGILVNANAFSFRHSPTTTACLDRAFKYYWVSKWLLRIGNLITGSIKNSNMVIYFVIMVRSVQSFKLSVRQEKCYFRFVLLVTWFDIPFSVLLNNYYILSVQML